MAAKTSYGFLGALRAVHGGGGGYYVRIAVGIWATMAAAK